MTEKELKKLNRYQLLELLVIQTERADALQKKVDELEEELEKREISLSQLGSIAEAAMHVSGVFEASQKAADLYLESAKKQADDIVECAYRYATSIIDKAKENVGMSSRVQQEDDVIESTIENTIEIRKRNSDEKEI